MSRLPRFRASEWIYIAYFSYVAILGLIFPLRGSTRWLPLVVLASVAALFSILSRLNASVLRDWLPVALTLLAYREMDWFTPAYKDRHLERAWIEWDRILLHDWDLQRVIEAFGPVIPAYLELCYLLVYAVGLYAIGVLYAERKRERVDSFVCIYALGGLLSYALFPYFPSDPPRTVFGWIDMPSVMTPIREFNLFLVNGYGIHSSVFPSAHVSTGFAAAWGLRRTLPERPWLGRGVLIYAISMSLATFYGRYHYAVDVAAGFAVSVAAIALDRFLGLTPDYRRARLKGPSRGHGAIP